MPLEPVALVLFGSIRGTAACPRIFSEWMEVYGFRVRVLSLDGLERAKRAAGRLKDLADLAEILEIRKHRG